VAPAPAGPESRSPSLSPQGGDAHVHQPRHPHRRSQRRRRNRGPSSGPAGHREETPGARAEPCASRFRGPSGAGIGSRQRHPGHPRRSGASRRSRHRRSGSSCRPQPETVTPAEHGVTLRPAPRKDVSTPARTGAPTRRRSWQKPTDPDCPAGDVTHWAALAQRRPLHKGAYCNADVSVTGSVAASPPSKRREESCFMRVPPSALTTRPGEPEP
jgi:hypothetical protein